MKNIKTKKGVSAQTVAHRSNSELSRRSFIVKSGLTVLGGSVMGYNLTTARADEAAQADAGISEEEQAPFKKIAKEKGVKLTVVTVRTARVSTMTEMHLDMDMIRASLENAIARAGKSSIHGLQEKLERLLAKGTAAQQVDFVLGTGRYMFPEDVEILAAAAEKDKFHSFGVICGTFCRVIARCFRNTAGVTEQELFNDCRDIFCPEKG